MDSTLWILYALFLLNADGNRYVVEGTTFKDKNECITQTVNNINHLATSLGIRLDILYGQYKWEPLEIGCVDKNGDPNERTVIIKEDWEEKDGEIIIRKKLHGVTL